MMMYNDVITSKEKWDNDWDDTVLGKKHYRLCQETWLPLGIKHGMLETWFI